MSDDPEGVFYLVFDGRGDLAVSAGVPSRAQTDLDAVIEDIAAGKYDEPKRVVAFNLAEAWASDVSRYVKVACALRANVRAIDRLAQDSTSGQRFAARDVLTLH